MSRTSALLTAALRIHSERTALIVLGGLTAALLILAYITLVMPNASYVAIYLNDVMGLTDAAYRTFRGQVPSVDFRSLYGAAIYYPAALGFYLDFSPGAVLGFGHFVTAVPLLILAVLASYRRFPLLHSVVLILFLFLLIVVPLRPGGSFHELTYAVYYTRHGWAALTIALLFYLEPRSLRRSDLVLDSIILSLLLLYLLYTKITFAAVAVAFVAINGMTSRYKMRLSLISLSIVVSVVAALFIVTEYNAAYFNDIFSVIGRSSAIRRGLEGMAVIVAKHLGIFLLCFAALTTVYLAGRRNIFDLVFLTCCIIASVMILDQSGGTERGLPALLAVFLICSELARRTECRTGQETATSLEPRYLASIPILFMMLVFVSEPMLQGGAALLSHFGKTTAEQSATGTNLSGFLAGAVPANNVHETLGHDATAHARVNELLGDRESTFGELTASEYLPLLAEGVELLESVPHDDHSVITFEHTNPFSVLLRMRPTKYGDPLFWAEYALLPNLPAPERYFSDADYVMIPEIPYSRRQLETLMTVYGSYLEENFYELKRSPHWRLYAR